MSIAWRFAQQGLRVTVYDAGAVGGESSWAGAGMLAPGGETDSRSAFAESLVASMAMYPSFVEELIAESGSAIDYRACGATEFAPSEDEWPKLLDRAARQRAFGIPSEVLRDGQLFYPGDAVVDPRHVTRALRVACERLRVEVHEGCPVREIRSEHGTVTAPRPAACAVLAAGAWSSATEVFIDGERQALEPAIPVRGHLVDYELDPRMLGPVLRNGATYIVQRSTGLTIGGSTHEHVGFDRALDPAIITDIEQRLASLMPVLASTPRAHAWIGFRPSTASGEAQTRRLGTSPVYLAYGHYRNGILLAPWVSDLIANWQTGSPLRAARPQSGPAPSGNAA